MGIEVKITYELSAITAAYWAEMKFRAHCKHFLSVDLKPIAITTDEVDVVCQGRKIFLSIYIALQSIQELPAACEATKSTSEWLTQLTANNNDSLSAFHGETSRTFLANSSVPSRPQRVHLLQRRAQLLHRFRRPSRHRRIASVTNSICVRLE
jgi:hypothetical protein